MTAVKGDHDVLALVGATHPNLNSKSIGFSIHLDQQEFLLFSNPSADVRELAKSQILEQKTAGVFLAKTLRPDAIFFDMDATVIKEESLVEIAGAAGVLSEIEALTQSAMAGDVDFSQSLRARLKILKGTSRDVVTSVKPTLQPGIADLCSWARTANIPYFLVSGGFIDLAGPLANSLGFKDLEANRFEWIDDKLSGGIVGPIVDGERKLEAIKSWCQRYRFDLSRCIAVGDGANDAPMLKACGLGVGFLPKSVLLPILKLSNQTGHHGLLLDLLKYGAR
jgi:phosphoserine phosphatase